MRAPAVSVMVLSLAVGCSRDARPPVSAPERAYDRVAVATSDVGGAALISDGAVLPPAPPPKRPPPAPAPPPAPVDVQPQPPLETPPAPPEPAPTARPAEPPPTAQAPPRRTRGPARRGEEFHDTTAGSAALVGVLGLTLTTVSLTLADGPLFVPFAVASFGVSVVGFTTAGVLLLADDAPPENGRPAAGGVRIRLGPLSAGATGSF